MGKALITGITGQDGSYLAELLLSKGYEVHGIVRRSSSINTWRIDHIFSQIHLHYGDMTDGASLARLIRTIEPTEIYNLAAQSHVKVSFECPEFTVDVAALGTLRMLEAIREWGKPVRFYQASSSELFGDSPPPQNEDTPMRPRSPYACGKLAAYWLVRNYREAYGLHASNGILFNHESPRRGETFVTRKIARAVAAIKAGREKWLTLGNINTFRDFGYAPEYVEGMWRMLQQPAPDDYVLATGVAIYVKEFVRLAFEHVGLNWETHVTLDRRYERPTEVVGLQGNASKAARVLGWNAKTSVQDLVRIMVDAEVEKLA